MKVFFLALSLLAKLAFSSNNYANRGNDWTGTCASGIRQSPINIDTKNIETTTDTHISVEGTDIASGSIYYADDEIKATTTNGKVYYKSEEENSNWTLAQFHFHAPSEHYIDNFTYSLEMHSVFTNDANTSQLLVVGIFFQVDDNASDDEFFTSLNLPSITTNNTNTAITNVPLNSLYKKVSGKPKYNYKGSLTTPTCDEAVEWFVVKDPMKINQSQLTGFTSHWAGNGTFSSGSGNGNNRAVANLNRRQVVLTRSDDDDDGWRITGLLFIAVTCLLAGLVIIMIIRLFFQKKAATSKSKKVMNVPQITEEGKKMKPSEGDEESAADILQKDKSAMSSHSKEIAKDREMDHSRQDSASRLPPIRGSQTVEDEEEKS